MPFINLALELKNLFSFLFTPLLFFFQLFLQIIIFII